MSSRILKPIYFILPPLVLILALVSFVSILDSNKAQSTFAQFFLYALGALMIIATLALFVEVPLLFYLALRKQKSIISPTQKTLFGKIESKEHATRVINHVSKVFVILGIIQIVFSTFVDAPLEAKIEISIIGVIYIGLALLLRKFKKPIIAVIFLLFSLASVLIASLNLFGILGNTQKRSIPIIGIAVVIASIQAIKATCYFHHNKI